MLCDDFLRSTSLRHMGTKASVGISHDRSPCNTRNSLQKTLPKLEVLQYDACCQWDPAGSFDAYCHWDPCLLGVFNVIVIAS